MAECQRAVWIWDAGLPDQEMTKRSHSDQSTGDAKSRRSVRYLGKPRDIGLCQAGVPIGNRSDGKATYCAGSGCAPRLGRAALKWRFVTVQARPFGLWLTSHSLLNQNCNILDAVDARLPRHRLPIVRRGMLANQTSRRFYAARERTVPTRIATEASGGSTRLIVPLAVYCFRPG